MPLGRRPIERPWCLGPASTGCTLPAGAGVTHASPRQFVDTCGIFSPIPANYAHRKGGRDARKPCRRVTTAKLETGRGDVVAAEPLREEKCKKPSRQALARVDSWCCVLYSS